MTTDKSFTWPPSSAAHCKADEATCSLGYHVASLVRHKNPQIFLLMSLINHYASSSCILYDCAGIGMVFFDGIDVFYVLLLLFFRNRIMMLKSFLSDCHHGWVSSQCEHSCKSLLLNERSKFGRLEVSSRMVNGWSSPTWDREGDWRWITNPLGFSHCSIEFEATLITWLPPKPIRYLGSSCVRALE